MWWGIGALGLVVGALMGATGVGAGILVAPLLILLGIPPAVAVGTDLAFSAVTKLVGSVRNLREGLVSRLWLARMGLPSVAGAMAGTALGTVLPGQGLRAAVAAVLLLASAATALKEVLPVRHRPAAPDLATARPALTGAIGVGIGLLVGMTSIGAGALWMAVLVSCAALSPVEAVATGLAAGAGLTLAAALLHLLTHTVDAALLGDLLLGSVPGVLLGARLAGQIPARHLRLGVMALIVASAVHMLA